MRAPPAFCCCFTNCAAIDVVVGARRRALLSIASVAPAVEVSPRLHRCHRLITGRCADCIDPRLREQRQVDCVCAPDEQLRARKKC